MTLYLTDPTSHQLDQTIQNLGDVIIKDAILANLQVDDRSLLHWVPLDGAAIAGSSPLILAGANILANKPYANPYVWRPRLLSLLHRHYAVLFGVGWWQYQDDPTLATRVFYRYLLRRQGVLHSVRDSYTETMLRKCGVSNVRCTGCPSMWNIPDTLVFDRAKPDAVVFTLTDYNRNPECDHRLLEILLSEYADLYFFPQGIDDATYLRQCCEHSALTRITILERSLKAYDRLLSGNIDYVGTRLHGGIRALQRGKRAFVIAVDNRAAEISRDTNLPVVDRTALTALPEKLNSCFSFTLKSRNAEVTEFRDALRRFIRSSESCRR